MRTVAIACADKKSGPPRRAARGSRATARSSHAGRNVFHVALKRLDGDLAHRQPPLAIALADDPHSGLAHREVLYVEPQRLADRAGRTRTAAPAARGLAGLRPVVASGASRRASTWARRACRADCVLLTRQIEQAGHVALDQLLGETEAVEGTDRCRLAPVRGRPAYVRRPAQRGEEISSGPWVARPIVVLATVDKPGKSNSGRCGRR